MRRRSLVLVSDATEPVEVPLYHWEQDDANRKAASRRGRRTKRATILHLLGLDHEKLSDRHSGRDHRLTDVYGDVVRSILS